MARLTPIHSFFFFFSAVLGNEPNLHLQGMCSTAETCTSPSWAFYTGPAATLSGATSPSSSPLPQSRGPQKAQNKFVSVLIPFRASANVIFLFYCIIQAVKMTLNNVQTAIKHQHLVSEEIKMQQEEGAAAGMRNDGALME